MTNLAQRIQTQLSADGQTMTFSVRISRKAYDQLQEVSDITGKKSAAVARACLEVSIEDLYGELLRS